MIMDMGGVVEAEQDEQDDELSTSAPNKEGIATVLVVTVMLDSLAAAVCDNNHAK